MKTKVTLEAQMRDVTATFLSRVPRKPRKVTHLHHFSLICSNRKYKKWGTKLIRSAWLWARWWGGQRRWKEKMMHSSSQGDGVFLTEGLDLMPPRNAWHCVEKEQGGREWEQCLTTSQEWAGCLDTSQTPLESESSVATMSNRTCSIGQDKIYGCLCAGLSAYLRTSTDLYLPVRGPGRACLSVSVNHYVWWCVSMCVY